MAIFGFHIVLTMITATFAHRLLPRFAPCSQWLASYLQRYAMPAKSNNDDRGGTGNRGKGRKKNVSIKEKIDPSEETLYRIPVSLADLGNIAFTTDVEIVFDFTLASVVVLSIAEMRAFIYPCEAASETNLSLVWCWIALGLAIRALFVTLRIFMRESSFLSVCMMSGCVFALLSMVVLSFPDNLVDLKLRESHKAIEFALSSAYNQTIAESMTDNAADLPQLNFNLFRGALAIFAGAFGTLLTFPGLRFVKLYAATTRREVHCDSWKERFYNIALRGFCHIALVLPLAVVLLWMKPVTGALFNLKKPGTDELLMSIRTGLMVFMSLSQLMICIPFLQTHLDGAEKRVSNALSKHNTVNAGRPAEKPADLRREVNIPTQSLGIVSVQVLTPALMMILMALLLKAALGASWVPENFRRNCEANETTAATANAQMNPSGPELLGQLLSKITYDESLTTLATDLATSLSRFRLAAGTSPVLWHSTIGFAVFWQCTVQLLTTMFGLWHARASIGDPDQGLF